MKMIKHSLYGSYPLFIPTVTIHVHYSLDLLFNSLLTNYITNISIEENDIGHLYLLSQQQNLVENLMVYILLPWKQIGLSYIVIFCIIVKFEYHLLKSLFVSSIIHVMSNQLLYSKYCTINIILYI